MAFKLANGSGKVITKLFWIVFAIGVILSLQMIYPKQVGYAIMAILGFSIIVFLFSFWFFRDPERWPDLEEENDRAIIAPADGKVIKVDKYLDEEYRMEESQIVSIFMSVFDVHVNRYPVKGKVEYVNYKKGKFMAAWNDKASEYNEQAVIGVNANGNQVTIKQIAGLIAQRIICYSDVGDEVEQSQKLGLIRFGSRVDIILPDETDIKVKVGDRVNGRVVVMADYGAFVEIAPGVEGLIHVSEMSWSQHLRSAQDFMKVGDEVQAQIITLDREERKMSLGLKQLKQDPWEGVEAKYAVNSKHAAKVRNFTNFGVFVEIEEGVDGLIHISDLSWTKKVKHPAEFTQIGTEIEVVVLEIDKDNRRLSLGHKQLEENPWDVFETIFATDSAHEGTIVEIFEKGAVVALPYGVEGFATPRHLVKEDGSQAKVEEKLTFKVIEFSKAAKRIILSHSRTFEDVKRAEVSEKKKTESANMKKGVKKMKDSIEKTTLGDISELAALKSKLEKGEK